LPRNGSSSQPGSLALRTVRDAQLPDGPFQQIRPRTQQAAEYA
jgi:hypothetical protein